MVVINWNVGVQVAHCTMCQLEAYCTVILATGPESANKVKNTSQVQ